MFFPAKFPLLQHARSGLLPWCYIGTIVDSMTWRQAKYQYQARAPGRPFGRPCGHAGMRLRRDLLQLLRPIGQSKS